MGTLIHIFELYGTFCPQSHAFEYLQAKKHQKVVPFSKILISNWRPDHSKLKFHAILMNIDTYQ